MPIQTQPATVPVSLKLDPATKARVSRLASSQKRTAHWIMRSAIEQYVEREEKREAFLNETIEAWRNYKEAGLHATSEDVFAWLDSWGSPNELSIPECQK